MTKKKSLAELKEEKEKSLEAIKRNYTKLGNQEEQK